jgi:hypothetical protein
VVPDKTKRVKSGRAGPPIGEIGKPGPAGVRCGNFW